MGNSSRTKEQVAQVKQTLFDQGYIDETFNQAVEVHCIRTEFHKQVVDAFFKDAAHYITRIEETLQRQPILFRRIEDDFKVIRRAAVSTGAKKLTEKTEQAINCCSEQNPERCKDALEQVKTEHATTLEKFHTYFYLASRLTIPEKISLFSKE